MSNGQRFCPLCDLIFVEGEAVLRCKGCGVMHHPACWVRNDGCATGYVHEQSPLAQSYTGGRTTERPDSHPAEGLRILRPTAVAPIGADAADEDEGQPEAGAPERPAPQPAAPSRPVASRPAPQPEARPERRPATEDFVIGSAPPADRIRATAPYVAEEPSRARRHTPPPSKPMPAVYSRHPLLTYWYVPVAVALAALVAAGVIFAADALFGDDDDAPATVTAPTATPAADELSPSATGTASATTAASPTTTSTTAGTFRVGDTALVTGTGNCLNIRSAAGTENDVVTCADEGTTVTILGGPEDDGEFIWWNIEAPGGSGWAAEQYLIPAP
jgi:hypothetical protein